MAIRVVENSDLIQYVSRVEAVAPTSSLPKTSTIILGLINIALFALIIFAINYSLTHVPAAETDRIYTTLGKGIQKSFRVK